MASSPSVTKAETQKNIKAKTRGFVMFCTDKRKGDDHGFLSLFKASQGLLRCNLQAEELAGEEAVLVLHPPL